jgi:hypothetical protein
MSFLEYCERKPDPICAQKSNDTTNFVKGRHTASKSEMNDICLGAQTADVLRYNGDVVERARLILTEPLFHARLRPL